jgi:RNA polymerase sigma factor (sigma-70 family)
VTDTNENFEFQMPEYSQGTVIRLLNMYLDIRMALIDRMPNPSKPLYSVKQNHGFREKPLGSSAALPWPFMTKPHATSHTDGKKRARMMEDLHAAAIDLEQALKGLSDDEHQMILDYYVFGGMTIEELAQARGLASKGRLQERLQRIIKKLTRYMNEGTYGT